MGFEKQSFENIQLQNHIKDKNLKKEQSLEDRKKEFSADELGLKIKDLIAEQTLLQNLPGIKEYLQKQKSLLEIQDEISMLEAILNDATKNDTDTRDGLNATIDKLRLIEQYSSKTSRELDVMDQNMTQEMIDGFKRMEEIEGEIIKLEANEPPVELKQVPQGLDKVDSFSLN